MLAEEILPSARIEEYTRQAWVPHSFQRPMLLDNPSPNTNPRQLALTLQTGTMLRFYGRHVLDTCAMGSKRVLRATIRTLLATDIMVLWLRAAGVAFLRR
jgi:hypothetical protein